MTTTTPAVDCTPPPTPALASDAFPAALRAAVAGSRMSLADIRTALMARGHTISVATLSYWCTGRRHPKRASSLAALSALEDVLAVPPGTLRDCILPRQSIGLSELQEIHEGRGPVAELFADLDLDLDDGLDRLSMQDLIEVDQQGCQASWRVRVIVRARRDGARRIPVTLGTESSGNDPGVRPRSGCAVGRQAVSADQRIMLVELLLEPTLRVGETLLVEFERAPGGPALPSTTWQRGLLRPAPLYLVKVDFHPSRMPTSVERHEQPHHQAAPQRTPMLVTSPTVSALFEDVAPGLTGLSWRW